MKTAIAAMLLGLAGTAPAQLSIPAPIPAAIYTDPAPDTANPARMAVVHIPSGGVAINGVVYVAAGPGPHPTVILCHGLPGNEKNIDLAQAMRRAGWTVITFNYRGSWGSPGRYRFVQNLEDADAVLAFAREPANATKLGIDPARLVMIGHSMGGWVTAMTAAHDHHLRGAALISAANIALFAAMPRADAVAALQENGVEALADTSPETMADEIIAHRDAFDFMKVAPALADTNLLVLSADDGLAPGTDRLVARIRAANGTKISTLHVATDHSWSDARIRLESEIVRWLGTLSPQR